MEYIFGTNGLNETLRTKGDQFTDLEGWQEVTQNFRDAKRTDRFRVIAKLAQDTDVAGNKYTWYTIDQHNTIIDKAPLIEAKLDYLYMMAGIDTPGEGGAGDGTDDGTQLEV